MNQTVFKPFRKYYASTGSDSNLYDKRQEDESGIVPNHEYESHITSSQWSVKKKPPSSTF